MCIGGHIIIFRGWISMSTIILKRTMMIIIKTDAIVIKTTPMIKHMEILI